MGLEYGFNEDSLHELKHGGDFDAPAPEGRTLPEYLFFPLILLLELVNDLDKFKNLGKSVLTALLCLTVVMTAVGISSLEAGFNTSGEFLGLLLGLVVCLEYRHYVERCFETAPYDILNTNLEEGVVRSSMALGVALITAVAVYKEDPVLHMKSGYLVFLLAQTACHLVLLIYVAFAQESFVREATGYLLLGLAAACLLAETVLCWLDIPIPI